jgi:hypothetical protein
LFPQESGAFALHKLCHMKTSILKKPCNGAKNEYNIRMG